MFTERQREVLAQRLNASRIASRQQGGKTLSYLEAWDVKAHLIRVFGYGNFDAELLDYKHIATREYQRDGKDMVEVVYSAKVRLEIREDLIPTDPNAWPRVCTYTEAACGSASGPVNMLGEHHDNALKTAESDALKRCATYLGNQFGLSLYDNGNRGDVVKGTILDPPKQEAVTTEQMQNIKDSLGATEVTEKGEQHEGDQS